MDEKKRFDIVDITPADTAFVSYGKNLDEVFANAGFALFETISDTKNVEQKEKRTVEANGYDLKSLLFSWLSELLFLSSSEHFLFSKFDVKIKETDGENKYILNAECWGEEIDMKKHEMKTEVKAITYHKMEIKEENGSWKAQVIVDI